MGFKAVDKAFAYKTGFERNWKQIEFEWRPELSLALSVKWGQEGGGEGGGGGGEGGGDTEWQIVGLFKHPPKFIHRSCIQTTQIEGVRDSEWPKE